MAAKNGRDVAWFRISYGIFAVGFSAIMTVAFADRLTNDPGIVGVIATIFSILCGVLIAVISILGDPSMLMDQSWRHSYLSAKETQRKLHRNTDVFVIYILLLAVVFVFSLLKVADPIYWHFQRATFFLTTLGFLASVSLPYSLMAVQKVRLEAAIKSMKNS